MDASVLTHTQAGSLRLAQTRGVAFKRYKHLYGVLVEI